MKTAVDSLRELCDKVPRVDRETTAVLRTNIDSVDACAGDLLWKVEGHYLLRWTLRSLISVDLTSAAIPYGQRLTDISERLLGRTHPMTLVARRDLARAFSSPATRRTPARSYRRTSPTRTLDWPVNYKDALQLAMGVSMP
ncbi:hypothetical protein [Streptomyces sp. NPDC088360]|uniref:hypothetical protein n=1 Tax=Streptomyces sp. NPDC088360 TaxID=3154515 RepID=UPI00344C3427